MARRGALGAAVVLLMAAVAVFFPQVASAHALIGKQDLPLPEWLFIYGALLILLVSFVGLLVGWQEPKLEDRPTHPLARASRILLSRPVGFICGLAGVGLLVLVVATGLTGDVAPDRNFSLTFVFVTFWIGLTLASTLFGEVFRPLNPWRAIARTVAAGFSRIVGQRVSAPLSYPEWLGRWPAVAGLVGFLFLELVWGQSGFTVAGITPRDVAVASLVYSLWTFIGMALFGIEKWTERGETFTVYFGMFASLSALTVEGGELRSRRVLSGTTTWATEPGSLALVLIAIGGTTFDGAQEGVLADPIDSTFSFFNDLGMSQFGALRVTDTLFLLGTLGVVALIFWAGIFGMRIVERDRSASELGRTFAHSFIPISLAYVVAHYFSYFVYLEQAQFTFLLSDPFGNDSNYFGTAGGGMATRVGDDNLFMNYAHVGHDCQIGNHVHVVNGVALAGHIVAEDHAIISGLAAVAQFVRIGESAFIGGGSMVVMDVPPFCMANGDRAKLVGLNVVGLERRGFTAEQVSALKRAYKLLFQSKQLARDAVENIRAELASSPQALHLADFVAASERGVTRP